MGFYELLGDFGIISIQQYQNHVQLVPKTRYFGPAKWLKMSYFIKVTKVMLEILQGSQNHPFWSQFGPNIQYFKPKMP